MRANQQTIVPLIMAACLAWFSACSRKEVQEESSPQEIARFERIETGINALKEKHGEDLQGINYDEVLKQLGDPDQHNSSNGKGFATWGSKVTVEGVSISIMFDVEYMDHQVLNIRSQTLISEAKYK